MSGLMSGDGKRGFMLPRLSSTLLSAIFLEKISEGKIGTANPQFFDSVRSVNL
jgi:hypothetical protein